MTTTTTAPSIEQRACEWAEQGARQLPGVEFVAQVNDRQFSYLFEGDEPEATPGSKTVYAYVGQRNEQGAQAWADTTNGLRNGRPRYRELDPRLDMYNHSPSGIEWGYYGSGPAQLALAILADYTRNDAYAQARHQRFKEDVIARLQSNRWVIAADTVGAWVDAHPLTEEECRRYRDVRDVDREIAETTPSPCCGAPSQLPVGSHQQ